MNQDREATPIPVEQWLQEIVGPAYDALKADPSRAVGSAKVRSRIAKELDALKPERSEGHFFLQLTMRV